MKHLSFSVFLILFLIGCTNSVQKKEPIDDLNTKIIATNCETYLSKLTELKKFNGVVLLKKDRKVISKKAYNISQDTLSSLFVSENSQFDLRSVAKLFAKVSVLKLENEGKLNRNDNISKYIEKFPNGNKITIDHLMSNTSGLPRELNIKNTTQLAPETVINLAKKEKLEFIPGSKEQYSNVGFQLLYYSIGKIHNATFYDYLKDTYFTPLKMLQSGSNFHNTKNKTKYAYGHYVKNKEIICECSLPNDEMQMGNLYSTVDDLDVFMSQLNSIKHKSIVHKGSISHAGGTRGKRAYVERNFADNYSILFLTNYDAIPFQQLVKDLQNMLKGKKVKYPKAINRKVAKISSEILKKYVGTFDFVDAGHLILDIKFENDSLYVYQKGKNNGVLYPESKKIFFGDKNSEESIQFLKNDKGEYYILMDFQGVQWKGTKIK